MFRILGFLMLSLLPVEACKWDRDTLKEEAKGNLDTVKAATGWFDRYPARYYEMRLERVAKELADDPGRLDLYDDAGVACDRLGRFDEAIGWMNRKKTALERLPAKETSEHRYRYLANLGSFYMDRWISREPEVRHANFEDLREAEKLVAGAIELNPGAHFGRERYQLQMIQWLLSDGPADQFPRPTFVKDFRTRTDAEDAVAGLTGLVLMGEGWMSVDVFSSLRDALGEADISSVAQLAYGRTAELEGLGKESLHPLAAVRKQMGGYPSPHLEGSRQARVDEYFKEARSAAEARRTAWLAYQDERFGRGMHPDTHADFWSDWKEPEAPPFPGLTIWEWVKLNGVVVVFSVVALMAAGLGFVCWRMLRRPKVARA